MGIFEEIYRQIYFIGIQTLRYGKRFFRWFLALLLKPVKVLGSFIFTILIVIDKHALKTFHIRMNELKALIKDAKAVSKKDSDAKGKKKGIKQIFQYTGVALRRYRKVFMYALNFILPIISLAVLVNVISFWSNAAFALEINYNDEVIGYVQNESVYKEARKLAFERLGTDATSLEISQEGNKETQLIGDAEYSIKMVKRSQINDASEICENLIQKTDNQITNACGIYIDDKFICAVKNETDALSVFDSILAEHETEEENAVVSFVENIDYVQGLYLDSEKTIKDAEYLQNRLKAKTSEARYYTAEEGDTLSYIAEKYEMTEEQIRKLNPNLPEDFQKGEKILLSRATSLLRVQTTKTELKEVEIPYETITVNTNNLYAGDKKVVTKGVYGVEQITQLVTYIDGVKVSTKEVARTTIKEPISEKIQVGTKKKPSNSTGNYTGGKLGWPTIGAYSISSPYGYRNFGDGWHGGIDIVRPGGSSGCTVVAAESGVVVSAGWRGSAGYAVTIDHGNGVTTMYYHMQNTIKVTAGQRVSRGQAIGNIGATGFVTGAHLHFEVKVNGKEVNPMLYLR